MASVMHNYGKENLLLTGTSGKVFRAMLMLSTYTPNADNRYVSDVSASEVTTGAVASYVRKTLANVAILVDLSNDKVSIDCDDIAWGSLESGATAGYVTIYVQTGGNDATPGDDVLIASCQFTATPTNGQAYTTTIPADGFVGDP